MTNQTLIKTQNESQYLNEDKSILTIELSAPGFNKEDFTLELDNNILTIEGTHKEGAPFSWLGNYKRRYKLNAQQLDFEKIDAQYEAGILKLNISRLESAIPKKRNIEVA